MRFQFILFWNMFCIWLQSVCVQNEHFWCFNFDCIYRTKFQVLFLWWWRWWESLNNKYTHQALFFFRLISNDKCVFYFFPLSLRFVVYVIIRQQNIYGTLSREQISWNVWEIIEGKKKENCCCYERWYFLWTSCCLSILW